MKARELVRLLKKDGWYEKNQKGSHLQLVHPVKMGKVTVPIHNGDIPKKKFKRYSQTSWFKTPVWLGRIFKKLKFLYGKETFNNYRKGRKQTMGQVKIQGQPDR